MMSLAVFDEIRERARTSSGTAILLPFDGTLGMEYDADGIRVFGMIEGVRTLIHACDWSSFDAVVVACIERGWCSSNETMKAMLSTLAKMNTYTPRQQEMMRGICVQWACLQHRKEVANV